MGEYHIPLSVTSKKRAIIFFLTFILGGLLAYPLIGDGAIYLSLLFGFIFAFFTISINAFWDPYKLSFGEDGVKLSFRLRPSKFVYFEEIESVFFSSIRKMPVMKLKGRGYVYSLSPQAAKDLLATMKGEVKP
jgi:hypothetical protein